MTHADNKLAVFIIASVIIHAVFIFRGQSTLLLPSSEGSRMQVSLTDKPAPLEQVKETSKLTKKPARLTEPTPEQQHTTAGNKVTKTTESHQQDRPEIADSGSKNLAAQPQIIAYIKHELQHYFYYPEMARRRGWQGHVVIKLDVTAAGTIQNVKLKHSSGYSILDNAALSSVNKIGLIPFIKQSGYTGTHTIQLPIEYQLKG